MNETKYNRVGDVTVKVGETKASKPITWNDAINAMSVEEKARFWVGKGSEMHNQACRYAWAQQTYKKLWDEHYVDKMTELLNSPYNGAQEGAGR
jgi:hypothetical protein